MTYSSPLCESDVIMGFRSCFLLFLLPVLLPPFDEVPPCTSATACLALLMTAFLMSFPFMFAVLEARRVGAESAHKPWPIKTRVMLEPGRKWTMDMTSQRRFSAIAAVKQGGQDQQCAGAAIASGRTVSATVVQAARQTRVQGDSSSARTGGVDGRERQDGPLKAMAAVEVLRAAKRGGHQWRTRHASSNQVRSPIDNSSTHPQSSLATITTNVPCVYCTPRNGTSIVCPLLGRVDRRHPLLLVLSAFSVSICHCKHERKHFTHPSKCSSIPSTGTSCI